MRMKKTPTLRQPNTSDFHHHDPRVRAPGELAANTMVTTGAMTKRIDRLVQAGLVTRRESTNDGRRRVVDMLSQSRREELEAILFHLIRWFEEESPPARPLRCHAERRGGSDAGGRCISRSTAARAGATTTRRRRAVVGSATLGAFAHDIRRAFVSGTRGAAT